MKRILSAFLATFLCLFVVACGGEKTYQDGTYRAEYTEVNEHNYRPYLVLTVQGGAVTAMEFDALAEDGSLLSADEEYRAEMEKLPGTYPQQYSADLINQYLVQQNIDQVDVVAGATISTENFKQLFTALEASMYAGNTETIYI
ncbi:MAG: FMN-binding protein [Oscillospiraceae bacterium]